MKPLTAIPEAPTILADPLRFAPLFPTPLRFAPLRSAPLRVPTTPSGPRRRRRPDHSPALAAQVRARGRDGSGAQLDWRSRLQSLLCAQSSPANAHPVGHALRNAPSRQSLSVSLSIVCLSRVARPAVADSAGLVFLALESRVLS